MLSNVHSKPLLCMSGQSGLLAAIGVDMIFHFHAGCHYGYQSKETVDSNLLTQNVSAPRSMPRQKLECNVAKVVRPWCGRNPAACPGQHAFHAADMA